LTIPSRDVSARTHANASAHGLSADDALKAVTLYPAQIFGLGRSDRSLETGKLANVIVTNGDPLELATDVKYIFIKGSSLPPKTSTSACFEKYFKPPKTLTSPIQSSRFANTRPKLFGLLCVF
jgi:adenine deaminase